MPMAERPVEPGTTMRTLVDQALRTAERAPAGAPASARLEYLVADIKVLRAAERTLRAELERALGDADAEARADGEAPRGHREGLVRTVQGAMSRAAVFETLGVRDIETRARAALKGTWDSYDGDWGLARLGGGRVALRAYGNEVAVTNEAPEILQALGAAGLSLKSTGPAVRLAEDLANRHDVVLG
ncbi:hypothetical protein ACFQ7N_38995 [Streptomyces niveus]|uniref:hypothetical protein n=1 Tax=Streptomyces niveus TaxID=193462 RepID=UPI0036AE5D2B